MQIQPKKNHSKYLVTLSAEELTILLKTLTELVPLSNDFQSHLFTAEFQNRYDNLFASVKFKEEKNE